MRRPMVGELSAAGLSTRAIAPIVGVQQTQIRRDLRQVSPTGSPEPASPASPDPAPVIGMDGKTYRRPPVDRETGEVLEPQDATRGGAGRTDSPSLVLPLSPAAPEP